MPIEQHSYYGSHVIVEAQIVAACVGSFLQDEHHHLEPGDTVHFETLGIGRLYGRLIQVREGERIVYERFSIAFEIARTLQVQKPTEQIAASAPSRNCE